MAEEIEKKIKPEWIAKALGNTSFAVDETINDDKLDEEAVILLQGMNLFGDAIFSYLKLTMRNFAKLSLAMANGENFTPSDFGEVVAAGRGQPSRELQDEMRVKHNLVSIPKMKPRGEEPVGLSTPKLFDDPENS